jgi:ATP-dependent RNA circularization protein (DNA/RNA ligase family)
METYHKINAPYYRHMDGPNKGKLIKGKWAVPEFEYLANNEWEYTEKVDGTNIRIWAGRLEGDREHTVLFGGRSDNATIPEPLSRYLHETFTGELFEKAELPEVVLYGEGYGPKIQGGGKYRSDHSFVLFDVKIGNWWLKREDVNDVAAKLGIESVPVLGHGTLFDAIDIVSDGLTSQWGNFEAEGLVIRPKVALFDRRGDRIITKIKGKDFR